MTKLYDGLVSDLLNNGYKYNPEVQALSYAILQEKQQVMTWTDQTRTMSMIEDLPESILDVLAVELRTPGYSESYSIEIKRELILGTLNFYRKLGTPKAVNWAIETIFGNGSIQEWFDYDGEPHHFRVTVLNDGTFSSLSAINDFLILMNAVKRLSSWLDSIIIVTDMGESDLYFGGLMAASTRLAIPEIPDVFDFESTLRTGGLMAASHRTAIPELADTFNFQSTLRSGGRMASTQRIPVPERSGMTMTSTSRIGMQGTVTITVPVPEISN